MYARKVRDYRNATCEAAARAALEPQVGRAITDAEWAAVQARLREFAKILRAGIEKGRTRTIMLK